MIVNTTLGMRGLMIALANVPITNLPLIRLYVNDLDPTADMVLADFTEADYTGYSEVAVDTLGVAWDDAGGNARQEYEAALFQPTGTAVPNVIVGWYMVGGGVGLPITDLVMAAERFPVPVTLASAADLVIVQAVLGINQPQGLTAVS